MIKSGDEFLQIPPYFKISCEHTIIHSCSERNSLSAGFWFATTKNCDDSKATTQLGSILSHGRPKFNENFCGFLREQR